MPLFWGGRGWVRYFSLSIGLSMTFVSMGVINLSESLLPKVEQLGVQNYDKVIEL